MTGDEPSGGGSPGTTTGSPRGDAAVSNGRSPDDAATSASSPSQRPPPATDAGAGAGARASTNVFNTSVLHEILINCAQPLDEVANRSPTANRDMRFPCKVVFDGRPFEMVGVRGTGMSGSVPRAGEFHKFGLNLKLDEFRSNQKLDGLDKLLLHNGRQDEAFVNEHLGYHIFRRARMAAALTAHAVVSFNDEPLGVYVIREAYDRDFLRRSFGAGNESGNLYKATCWWTGRNWNCPDFVTEPLKMELKHEAEEMRTKDDLVALAALIRKTPIDDAWIAAVSQKMDLDRFITEYALEGLVLHWDGYAYDGQNYFLYANPLDHRIVMIPHGADSLFGIMVLPSDYNRMPYTSPITNPPNPASSAKLVGALTKMIWSNPTLLERYKSEFARLQNEVWDVPELLARLDEVTRVLHSTKRTDARTQADLSRHDNSVGAVKRFIEGRKTVKVF